VPLPKSLKIGDWCGQGLAFYSGSVTYRQRIAVPPETGERVFVGVPDYHGAAVRVLVDGRPAGVTAWAPNEVEITDLVADARGAEVELGIEVIGHRRNSHGPLHHAQKQPYWWVRRSS